MTETMNKATSICKLMSDKKIRVPDYQRAYSWGGEQTYFFLTDLQDHIKVQDHIKDNSEKPYFLGHFLFEEDKKDGNFLVIDGQQRLTTIVIFLSALFTQLKNRNLTAMEKEYYEGMVKHKNNYRFETVNYDNELFQTYVIEQSKESVSDKELKTNSARCIKGAFDYFKDKLKEKSPEKLAEYLETIANAECTTHLVKDTRQAIQIFTFQNDRGKNPTEMEKIKALFMYNIHLHAGDALEESIKEIKERFAKINELTDSIPLLDENDILYLSSRIHYNEFRLKNDGDYYDDYYLKKNDVYYGKILPSLDSEKRLDFISRFTQCICSTLGHLDNFYNKKEKESFTIHSLISLGGIQIALPFIIKYLSFDEFPFNKIETLCKKLEGIILRHSLIGTRAGLEDKLNSGEDKCFEKLEKDTAEQELNAIIGRINLMKKPDGSAWWWAYWSYWNNAALEEALKGDISHYDARHLLWRYENHLGSKVSKEYKPKRFDITKKQEIEHIAPRTKPKQSPHGYGPYGNTKFEREYIPSLGNLLLISKSRNRSIGNAPFPEKIETYTENLQQKEVVALAKKREKQTGGKLCWISELIKERQEKIIKFILEEF